MVDALVMQGVLMHCMRRTHLCTRRALWWASQAAGPVRAERGLFRPEDRHPRRPTGTQIETDF